MSEVRSNYEPSDQRWRVASEQTGRNLDLVYNLVARVLAACVPTYTDRTFGSNHSSADRTSSYPTPFPAKSGLTPTRSIIPYSHPGVDLSTLHVMKPATLPACRATRTTSANPTRLFDNHFE